MHQQSLFCRVRTEEPSSSTFQKIARGTWHTPLVHNLGDTLLSFWAVKMPKNCLAVVAVSVLFAGMCEALCCRGISGQSFLGTEEHSPGGCSHRGHKAGKAGRCWKSLEIQIWKHGDGVSPTRVGVSVIPSMEAKVTG